MKIYHVTINLRIAAMKHTAGSKATDQAVAFQSAAQGLANTLAGNEPSVACEVVGVVVVDHDSLPKQAHLCARCNERKGA